MMSMTRKQHELLSYIKDYIAKSGGVAPSFEEMKGAIGIASKSGVHRLLQALEERGLVRRLPDRARALVVVPERPLLAFSTEELSAELERRLAA